MKQPNQHRRTKILCTLGPQTATRENVLRLAESGMNIARINASHGTREQHKKTIDMLRSINDELSSGRPALPRIGILLDTKGAEIRTGDVESPIKIAKGQEVIFSPHPIPESKNTVIIVAHDKFAKDVQQARSILVDNGELTFELLETRPDGTTLAKALQNGSIGSRRHVNLPGATLSMPSFTEKDWDDIAFGAEEGVDFLALSFVRAATDLDEVRAFVAKKPHQPLLIAKIETREALQNIAAIVHATDAIMVARGDLGAEMPFEDIPVIQDRIVALCREQGKPVIVATHMLESMIKNPMPTRAEATDIAHAVMSGADATMLSGETASGTYPLEAFSAMDKVLRATESHMRDVQKMDTQRKAGDDREAQARAAVDLATSIDAASILVFTRTGRTARDIAKFRPSMPVIAFTPFEESQRKLQLIYSVTPHTLSFAEADPEATVKKGINASIDAGLLQEGDRIVLVSDSPAGKMTVNTIQVRSV